MLVMCVKFKVEISHSGSYEEFSLLYFVEETDVQGKHRLHLQGRTGEER
jgi:hypothetical protein